MKFRHYFDKNFFDEMSSSEKLSEIFFDDVYPPKIYLYDEICVANVYCSTCDGSKDGRTHRIALFLRKYPVYCMHIAFWITSLFHDVLAYVKLDLSRY